MSRFKYRARVTEIEKVKTSSALDREASAIGELLISKKNYQT